jgi:NAD(P)-dependent dehydrogenase (short-subunit alcohol dehydrogenase family)
MSKVWLVTGGASGLGRHIADAALASGDRLLAAARDPHRLDDLVKKYGDQLRTASRFAVLDQPRAGEALKPE